MAIKFDLIEVGTILYDRHRHKQGTGSVMGEWPMKVLEVDGNGKRIRVMKSGREMWVTKYRAEKYFRSPMKPKEAKP